jgi:hypothetical protein
MQSKTDWTQWAESLQRLKLNNLVAWFLEAGAPLTLLGAQVLYATQPFLGGKQSTAIAQLLEDNEQTYALARVLRGERIA